MGAAENLKGKRKAFLVFFFFDQNEKVRNGMNLRATELKGNTLCNQ